MRHVRRIHPGGLHLAGLSRGFGGAFDVGLTPGPGGVPIGESVQTSELAVTGTFAARAPTLLDAASRYQTSGDVVRPSVTYGDGTVITADGRQQRAPAGWSPDPRTWGSPTDAITGAKRVASDADQQAIDNQLTPGVTAPPNVVNEAVDGQWQVGPNGEIVATPRITNGGGNGMKWWHWALIGGAVLGGVALVRAVAR